MDLLLNIITIVGIVVGSPVIYYFLTRKKTSIQFDPDKLPLPKYTSEHIDSERGIKMLIKAGYDITYTRIDKQECLCNYTNIENNRRIFASDKKDLTHVFNLSTNDYDSQKYSVEADITTVYRLLLRSFNLNNIKKVDT